MYLSRLEKHYQLISKKILPILRKPYTIIAVSAIVLFAIGGTTFVLGNRINGTDQIKTNQLFPTAVPIETLKASSSAKLTPPIQQKTSVQPSVTPKVTNSPTPARAAPNATATPTKAPARVPNPPIINISYPSENQAITFTSSTQTFCVVDTPSGGDTAGLQRKHNINNQGWNAYVDMYTLCFTPKDGDNTMILQYKNKYGDESTTYTRQFTFHLSLPTPTAVPAGCTPVTFSKTVSDGKTTVKIEGAWWLDVSRSNPKQDSTDFDTAQKIIYLYFSAPSATIPVYTAGYEGAPLCQTYSF